MNKKIQDNFIKDLEKLTMKYIDKYYPKTNLNDLIISADFYFTTIRQLNQEKEKEHRKKKQLIEKAVLSIPLPVNKSAKIIAEKIGELYISKMKEKKNGTR